MGSYDTGSHSHIFDSFFFPFFFFVVAGLAVPFPTSLKEKAVSLSRLPS